MPLLTWSRGEGAGRREQRAEIVARPGAAVTCEGHALTVHNSCPVLAQFPMASMVGGFRQWQGRGLMIWAPTLRKADAELAPAEAHPLRRAKARRKVGPSAPTS